MIDGSSHVHLFFSQLPAIELELWLEERSSVALAANRHAPKFTRTAKFHR
jgi:hypothetical protein